MKFADVFSLSLKTVGGNKLRTALTVTIIAFGIMALVGIITAIKAMNQKFSESFASMGANAFAIRYKERNISFGGGSKDLTVSKKGKKEKKSNLNKIITRREAEYFAHHYSFPGTATSLSIFGRSDNIVSFNEKKTSPNVMMFGGDENYLDLNAYKLIAGRNMTSSEIKSAQNVCIVGYEIIKRFFGEPADKALNHTIKINSIPYKVIGVLEEKGTTFGFNRDNMLITSYTNIERNFSKPNYSYVIAVKVNDIASLEMAVGEAEGLLRNIRKINIIDDSNFSIDRSDSIVEKAMNSLRFLTISATVIGLITLIGAAIGLMNIMLVSVAERTKEVGLIKAIGGKKKIVKQQFLIEAIIISILGAILGIVLGILVGNAFSIVLNTGFVVPWAWIFYGIAICTMVGLLAGIYPAIKAGRLNPIDALRYE
ncbi:MAG TPA: ABC transporter permease [Niabella sp.]|nr:ABC transporter permease [Niabella sp.]HRO84347.1 ABC transporter permease [Niabella sp.]HUN01763.1 ABC transporter permease [Niabella sp.]